MTNRELGFIAIGTVAVGIAVAAYSKISQLCRRLNTSLDDIESRTTISVSEQIIDTVVADVAKRKVEQTVTTKVNKAVEDLKASTDRRIQLEMNAAYASAKTKLEKVVEKEEPSIRSRLETDLRNVSIDKVKKEVIEEAVGRAKVEALRDLRSTLTSAISELEDKADDLKDEMEEHIKEEVDDIIDDLKDDCEDRFKNELDNLTSRYKNRLDDVSDIYASFANKIAK